MVRFLVFLVTSLALLSCIDQVQLPIRPEEPRLVVDGQITNEAPPYGLRLTYTGPTADVRYVLGAQVSIADDQGRTTRFSEQSPGVYRTTDSTFRGQVGRAYSLTIALSDGKRYVSKPERMPAVPPIDSISARIIRTDNIVKQFQFEYRVNTRDPAGERNYYRWTAYGITNRLSTGVPCCLGCPFYCFDRCWVTESTTAVNVYSDAAVNGNPIRGRLVFQLPIYAIGPQLVEVIQYGITQTNYQFWTLYQQQSARTGSIFDPLPAPVTGNLVNVNDPTDVARGYFATQSVTRQRIRAQNYNVPFYTALYGFLSSQIVPQGDCRNIYGPVPVTEPDGW